MNFCKTICQFCQFCDLVAEAVAGPVAAAHGPGPRRARVEGDGPLVDEHRRGAEAEREERLARLGCAVEEIKVIALVNFNLPKQILPNFREILFGIR